MKAIVILSALAAIAATVLAYIFIIPEKKRATLNKLGKLVHDILNFKFLIIEKLVQFFYVLATASTICFGFFMLFYFPRSYRYDYFYGEYVAGRQWSGWVGFIIMILGPIVIRLVYELIMMGILVVKNVIQINNKLKNQNEDSGSDPFSEKTTEEYEFKLPKKEKKERVVYQAPPAWQPAPEPQPTWQPAPAPQPAPQPAPAPQNFFCSECGSRLENGVCPNCGK